MHPRSARPRGTGARPGRRLRPAGHGRANPRVERVHPRGDPARHDQRARARRGQARARWRRALDRVLAAWLAVGEYAAGDLVANVLRSEAEAIADEAMLDLAALGRAGAAVLPTPFERHLERAGARSGRRAGRRGARHGGRGRPRGPGPAAPGARVGPRGSPHVPGRPHHGVRAGPAGHRPHGDRGRGGRRAHRPRAAWTRSWSARSGSPATATCPPRSGPIRWRQWPRGTASRCTSVPRPRRSTCASATGGAS